MRQQESYVGVFDRIFWRSEDGDRILGRLEDGTTIVGAADDGELVPGVVYEFYGRWDEHPRYGRQFKFTVVSEKQPHSREGVVNYLSKYAPHVGPAIAALLWDAFAGDAVKVLRTQPEVAILAPGVGRHLTLEKAVEAASALQKIVEWEDTKIELVNLFHGRGFPGQLIDDCLEKWGILAPKRIRRDPFVLLVNEMRGCGFARCDRLYLDLGHDPSRLKRQVICLWHVLTSDTSGHTWFDAKMAVERLSQLVGGAIVTPVKAIKMAVRARWLAKYRDRDGRLWVADADKARSEDFLAQRILVLAGERPASAGSTTESASC